MNKLKLRTSKKFNRNINIEKKTKTKNHMHLGSSKLFFILLLFQILRLIENA